jgi:hypothetical protein
MYLVEDFEIEERYNEFRNTDVALLSPEYRIQLMILCVLGDIRKLLEPVVVDKLIEKEVTDGREHDELEH